MSNKTEIVVRRAFGGVVLPHHDQQSSDDKNPTEHGYITTPPVSVFGSAQLCHDLISSADS